MDIFVFTFHLYRIHIKLVFSVNYFTPSDTLKIA